MSGPGTAHTGGDRQSVPYCDKSFPGQTISVVVVDSHCVELASGATGFRFTVSGERREDTEKAELFLLEFREQPASRVAPNSG